MFPGRYRIGFRWDGFSRSQYFRGAQTLDAATGYRVAAGEELSVVDRAVGVAEPQAAMCSGTAVAPKS